MTDMNISKARERELLEELFDTVSFDVESEGIPKDPEGEAYPEDDGAIIGHIDEELEAEVLSAFDRALAMLEAQGQKDLGVSVNHPVLDRIGKIKQKAFAVHFGLSESKGTPEDTMEFKVRRVRTPAGVSRYKQPIGSIIVRDVRMANLRINEPKFDGWDSVTGANGKNYDVGKVDGEFHAYGEDNWDDLVASAKTEDELYKKLDAASAKKGKGKTPVPVANSSESSFKDKDERDDYVWDNTTYPQWDVYEGLEDDEKETYAAERNKGVKHRAALLSATKKSKESDDAAKPEATKPKEPVKTPAAPSNNYAAKLEEAGKLTTPAQKKQLKRYLKDEQMVDDYLSARKAKRSHAQAMGDAVDADIERAKGGKNKNPKVPAGQGTLF